MRAFTPYVKYLESLLARATTQGEALSNSKVLRAALDGEPGKELRRVVSLEEIRAAGAFFTGSTLAQDALKPVLSTIGPRSVVFDPACGAGDLLLAWSRHLPVSPSFSRTMALWGKCMVGQDVHSEFTSAAKARLALEAIHRGSFPKSLAFLGSEGFFPHIKAECSLSQGSLFQRVSHIVLNPPFGLTAAPSGCTWALGTVNAAAVFLETCLLHAKAGTILVAILPDVLRSGTRYRKWRRFVESRSRVWGIRTSGQFAAWSDVHVFSMVAQVTARNSGRRPTGWNYPKQVAKERVCDRFSVSVGSVVSFRDPHRGSWFPFICARDVPPWATVKHIQKHRRFEGRTFQPPFVVVRRTSRPGDKHRGVGTIITGVRRVAVENHLLVLQPKDGKLTSCRSLMKMLRSARVNAWLDKRIRCRHLTVSAVRQLPWWGEDQ